MPSSIDSVQGRALNEGFLDKIGEEKEDFRFTEGVFEQLGKEFLLNLGKFANKRKVIASGKLLSESRFDINGNIMRIIVPDYFDYPNEGVQGVKSSKNAPNSPYKFKHYGMNAEGRASIKEVAALWSRKEYCFTLKIG